MLGLNFAETFPFEKQYAFQLLKLFRRQKKKLSLEDISDKTGIPMGKTTGKVKPHIDYLLGMGLIRTTVDKWYELTTFGKVVYEYDKNFTEPLTIWGCHAFMAGNECGAEVYNEIFKILRPGIPVKRQQVDVMLSKNFGKDVSSRVLTPFWSTYTREDSLGKGYIIQELEPEVFIFNPVKEDYQFIPMYGAFVCHMYEFFFPNKGQVSIYEFNETTGFGRVFGKTNQEVIKIMNTLAGEGYVTVQNLVDPPVISKSMNVENAWESYYDNMI